MTRPDQPIAQGKECMTTSNPQTLLKFTRTWFNRAFVLLYMTMQTNSAVATSPPYVAPTLAQKVKDSELILVARVGQLKYMKWPSKVNSEGAWEVSDVPVDDFSPYLNLIDIKVLHAKPPTNDVQRINEKPDLPLWVHLGGCFPFTWDKPFKLPSADTRIFFLSRKLLRSANSLHSSKCSFPSIEESDMAAVIQAIGQSKSKTNTNTK